MHRNEPTEIVSYEVTQDRVNIIGKDFSFGGARQYLSLEVSVKDPGVFVIHGVLLTATIRMQKVPQ